MNAAEAADLLVLAATFDGRTVEDGDPQAWARVLGNMTFATARSALESHYATTHRRVMPSDLWALVKAGTPEHLGEQQGKCPFRDCRCSHTAPCSRGWIENDSGVSPCPTCRPEQARIVAESAGRDAGPGRLADLRDRGRRR